MSDAQAVFHYRNNILHAEEVPVQTLVERFGTPLYVYSHEALTAAYQAYAQACVGRRAQICYAVKANSNLGVLNLFAKLGAGFDTVSGGELARVLAAGGQANRVVFSGVGKSAQEMRLALDAGVKCFNVESFAEMHLLNEVAAALGKRAPIAVRVNPHVDAHTHPYIATGLKTSKFGINFEQAEKAYALAAALPHLEVVGIDCHIGSQLTKIEPYLQALDTLFDLIERVEAQGLRIAHIDIGGGLGICYEEECPPAPGDFVRTVLAYIDARGHGHREIIFEPGRSLVGQAGIMLTRVEYLKPGEAKNFVIVDAAMNDLARPAMYQAYHKILPARQTPESDAQHATLYDVVGPVCESGDWLAKDRTLCVEPGDILALCATGAYGFVMSSNYNTRPRAAEVIVAGDRMHLVRARETVESLYAQEHCLPEGSIATAMHR